VNTGREDDAARRAGEFARAARSAGCPCHAPPGVPYGPAGDHLARYLYAEQRGAITRAPLREVIAGLDVIERAGRVALAAFEDLLRSGPDHRSGDEGPRCRPVAARGPRSDHSGDDEPGVSAGAGSYRNDGCPRQNRPSAVDAHRAVGRLLEGHWAKCRRPVSEALRWLGFVAVSSKLVTEDGQLFPGLEQHSVGDLLRGPCPACAPAVVLEVGERQYRYVYLIVGGPDPLIRPLREGELVGRTTRWADHAANQAQRCDRAAGHAASGHEEGRDFVAVSCPPWFYEVVE